MRRKKRKNYELSINDAIFFSKKFYAWAHYDNFLHNEIYQHKKTFYCTIKVSENELQDFFKYTLNNYGFRSDNFKKENPDFLYAGCSETFGQGGPIEDSWPHMLNKKLNNNGSYINVSFPGAGWSEIISNVFTYIEKFGIPKNIFLLLPNIERRTIYGFAPLGKLSKIKLFRNWIEEDKSTKPYFYLWWVPGMSRDGNKYPRKYRLNSYQYKSLFLQRYDQIRTLSKVCNALGINLTFAINSDIENNYFDLIKQTNKEDLKSFFQLQTTEFLATLKEPSIGKYDGHRAANWHQFVANEMYKHWEHNK
jgi:hypothetical protein